MRETFHRKNKEEGIQQLVEHKKKVGQQLIVVESTGRLETGMVATLYLAQLPIIQ